MEEMIGVMMLIAAGTAVGVLMAYILGRSRNASAGYYDVLRIEGGRLISFYHGLCGSVEESYALDEIRLVRFTCRATKGNLTFMGEMQIVKKDGQKSRLYVYDGSTFEKTLVWRTSRALLLRTTQELTKELARHGIRTEVDPLMYRQ